MSKIELRIENKNLVTIGNFLTEIPNLSPAQGRALRKFTVKLNNKVDDFNEGRKLLLEKFAVLKKDGQPEADEMGNIIFKEEDGITAGENKQAYLDEFNKLQDEFAVLIGGEYASQFKVVRELLENLDETGMRLNYTQASGYDVLLDAFETAGGSDDNA